MGFVEAFRGAGEVLSAFGVTASLLIVPIARAAGSSCIFCDMYNSRSEEGSFTEDERSAPLVYSAASFATFDGSGHEEAPERSSSENGIGGDLEGFTSWAVAKTIQGSALSEVWLNEERANEEGCTCRTEERGIKAPVVADEGGGLTAFLGMYYCRREEESSYDRECEDAHGVRGL